MGRTAHLDLGGRLPTYRFIVQGEGVDPDGAWFGFYAGRQAWGNRSDVAEARVLDGLKADWVERESTGQGRLTMVQVACAWRAPLISWPPLPKGGHAFYNDDHDAQVAAFDIEAEASRAPKPLRAQHSP